MTRNTRKFNLSITNIIISILLMSGFVMTGTAFAAPSLKDESCTIVGGCGEEIQMPNKELQGDTLQAFLKIVFAISGVLSVLFVAIGGFKYTMSTGDPNSIQSAKNTILYALVGLVVSISAFTIVSLVIGKV